MADKVGSFISKSWWQIVMVMVMVFGLVAGYATLKSQVQANTENIMPKAVVEIRIKYMEDSICEIKADTKEIKNMLVELRRR